MSATDVDTNSTADEPPRDPNAVSISIDGEPVEARKGEWIIAAADRAGTYIPRFCYHPRMDSVGMCRQCLVEVEGPRGPMMVVSCMTPVADGQVVRTDTDQVKRAQEGIIELLLANHPLDCPVCDKGGECPLQDQAFSHGPGESRYVEEKRHYEKPIAISDLVYLDRERCILCDRCTRFADEVAGDPLIHFTHRGNNTQVLTFPDEPFASYFSGNTVQICPVGALTAKPYRFKARPWDLEEQATTCTTCAVGCRMSIQSSRDELVRYQGIDNDAVNWGWLCDRGRFNFESVNNAERRVAEPLLRQRGAAGSTVIAWSDALARVARAMSNPSRTAILGGARGTNEDAWAWAELARRAGIVRHDPQLADGLPASIHGLPQATIGEACSAPTVVLMAPDLKEELPVLFIRLRDAARRGRIKIVEIGERDTSLTPHAWRRFTHEAGAQPQALDKVLADRDVVAQAAQGPVVVVAGRANMAVAAEITVSAVARLVESLPNVSVLPVNRRGNVRGALALGLAPVDGDDSTRILRDAVDGAIDCLVLLGCDPLADHPDAELVRSAFARVPFVVSVDTHLNDSSAVADIVLPAAAFGEKSGTTTNVEGRVSPVARLITAHGTSRPDWMIAAELAGILGHDLGVTRVEDVTRRITDTVPGFDGASTRVTLRRDGHVVRTPGVAAPVTTDVRAPERNSYDFRLVLARKLYDSAVGTAASPSLAGLAEGAGIVVNPLDLPRIGVQAGDDVRVTNAQGAVVVPVRTSDNVQRGTAFVAHNQPGPDLRALVSAERLVTDVGIESL